VMASTPKSTPNAATSKGSDEDLDFEDAVESGFDEPFDDAVATDASLSSSLADLAVDQGPVTKELSEEERHALEAEIRKIEEESNTLRLVLQAKTRRATELRRKLGVSQLDEIKADVASAIKTVHESDAYLKTTATLQDVAWKTRKGMTVAVTAVKDTIANRNNNNDNALINENQLDGEDTMPRPKVGNTIFRETTARISSAVSATGSYVAKAANETSTYVSMAANDVRGSPSFKAVGQSIGATWSRLTGRRASAGAGADGFLNDTLIGEGTTTGPPI